MCVYSVGIMGFGNDSNRICVVIESATMLAAIIHSVVVVMVVYVCACVWDVHYSPEAAHVETPPANTCIIIVL